MAPAEPHQLDDAISERTEREIHRDVLETILSHVPLIHLVSASHVSKSWYGAVSSSLRHVNRPKPWLLLHTQSTRHPYSTTTHAYDPRSKIWIKTSQPSIKHTSAVRSSHSSFLYSLSPSHFSFSSDPLNLTWTHVGPPLVWRVDPIVARVGNSVVIAGGACDFEDDPFAVEILNLETGQWESSSESMPATLKDSAASSGLSIAATAGELIVSDRHSGVTHCFDPETKSWTRPVVLNPGQPASSYNIGFSDLGLVLVGVCGNGEGVKVWAVSGEELRCEKDVVWGVSGKEFRCEEVAEMPAEYVERLKRGSFENWGVNVRVAGRVVYVYNTWYAEEVVACELAEGGEGCRWWSVENVVAREGMLGKRMVVTCGEVGLEEVRQAHKDWVFEDV